MFLPAAAAALILEEEINERTVNIILIKLIDFNLINSNEFILLFEFGSLK